MTVLENVIEAPLRVKGLAKREAISGAEELLARIGLAEKRPDSPSRLSGGQQQRVAVVRALAMAPKAMLFDEVTSALDPELVGEVLDLLGELALEGRWRARPAPDHQRGDHHAQEHVALVDQHSRRADCSRR